MDSISLLRLSCSNQSKLALPAPPSALLAGQPPSRLACQLSLDLRRAEGQSCASVQQCTLDSIPVGASAGHPPPGCSYPEHPGAPLLRFLQRSDIVRWRSRTSGISKRARSASRAPAFRACRSISACSRAGPGPRSCCCMGASPCPRRSLSRVRLRKLRVLRCSQIPADAIHLPQDRRQAGRGRLHGPSPGSQRIRPELQAESLTEPHRVLEARDGARCRRGCVRQ